MRLRTFRWLFAISFLLLLLSACSAVSAQPGSTPALGTTGLRIKNPFNVFTVAWSPNGKYLALGGTKGTVQVRDAATGRAKKGCQANWLIHEDSETERQGERGLIVLANWFPKLKSGILCSSLQARYMISPILSGFMQPSLISLESGSRLSHRPALARAASRSRCTSRIGGTPKRLLYSRLKWEVSLYPTR